LPEMGRFDVPSHIKIYLIGFSYDPPTTQMSAWLRDILSSRKISQDNIVRFNDDSDCSRESLARILADGTPRVEVFCGHGVGHGLSGPPRVQAAGSILNDLSFVIYDTDMITVTPSSMFAFCCQAARNFGRVFTSYKDKQFMGFKDDIPFPIELFDPLKYVFQTVAKDIIQTGGISPNHKNMFLEKIKEIALQSSNYQNPTLVQMWLDEYSKHLMVYL
jgi:hypothetical protein